VLPDFLIVGAQKAATTFVQESLRRHPDVFLPPGETPFFEDPEYATADPARLREPFASAPAGALLGLKRAHLLGRPECPARIARHLPEARLIAVLRHPVDRAVSAFFWYVKIGLFPVLPVDEGLAGILAGDFQRRYPKSQEILDYGLYHRQLERYGEHFAADRMLVLLHEDFGIDAPAALARIQAFLGLDRPLEAVRRRPKQSVYALPRLRFLSRRNRWVYRYTPDRMDMEVRRGPLPGLVNSAFAVADRLLLAPVFGNAKPALPSELRSAMLEHYAEDVGRLEGLLGRSLEAWRR
jgi:hypothetical protein